MHAALVERSTCCIRRLGGQRSQEARFRRFLKNGAVTVKEMVSRAAEHTAGRVADRDIVIIHDTSELAVGGRRARANGYGPIGKGGSLGGLLLHAALAIDADSGALLGLADAAVWNRSGGNKVSSRRSRRTADKESQRWIETTRCISERLAAARSLTGISDRESDFYEYIVARPSNVHLIVRACQDRKVKPADEGAAATLFSFIDQLAEVGRFETKIPAAPGRKERRTILAVRFAAVELCRPRNGAAPELPATTVVTLVDVREVAIAEDSEPIHWRLLTTRDVSSFDEARHIVELYRLRWTIEEFFRTLKTAGFDIEAADLSDPYMMINLVGAATVAAVTVMQLVKARDGTTDRQLSDAFEPEDRPILEALSKKLEGKTQRQKNPHPKGSLAFASWVIARLGGWIGYYGKPGPKVMRRGLDDFQRIKFGTTLRLEDV